ncbi:hypothetical protein BLNAU_16436 [Blattamonas nauphoetae]|uniref:Uncharacterized protein n=1 Tax=Blattamonas nauphoetae TaxID=2049346 RepID=A0ABQ9XBG1_9EUKA|nr:hypothetical protein BLNAU_16436 [Blattamonas nauphoetae]
MTNFPCFDIKFQKTPSLTSIPIPTGKIDHHSRRSDDKMTDEEIEPPKVRKSDKPQDKSKPTIITPFLYPSCVNSTGGSDSVSKTPKIFRGNSPYHPQVPTIAIPISSRTPTKRIVERGLSSSSTTSAKENNVKEANHTDKNDQSNLSEEQHSQLEIEEKVKSLTVLRANSTTSRLGSAFLSRRTLSPTSLRINAAYPRRSPTRSSHHWGCTTGWLCEAGCRRQQDPLVDASNRPTRPRPSSPLLFHNIILKQIVLD